MKLLMGDYNVGDNGGSSKEICIESQDTGYVSQHLYLAER